MNGITKIWESKKNQLIIIIFGILLLLMIGLAAALFLPQPIDWIRTYRPATRELLALRTPYSIKSFYNPPWILIPTIPFALLPDRVGNGLLFVISFVTIIYSAIKSGGKALSVSAFMLSFPVLFLLLFGQIDWLILLGFTLPPQIGLFFILAKPQIAIPFTAYFLIDSFRKGGIKQVTKVFLPVTLAYIFSFAIFGIWFENIDSNILTEIYNFSLWPFGIPIGIALIIKAIRLHKERFSIIAGPFFSPYVGVHSWSIPLLAILPNKWETLGFSLGTWIVCLIKIL